jgi:lipopolysaccharide transport system permease protein
MIMSKEEPTAPGGGEATVRGGFDAADFDVVLESRPGWRSVDFAELLRNRDLCLYWTLRNLKARHAQSALGIAWAVIQPAVHTAIFTVVFGGLVGVASDGVPYPLFALVGMVVWTYFSGALREGVESLTRNTHMLGKIYFPRLILPLSAVLGKLLDLAIGGVVVVPLMIWYGAVPRPEALVVLPALLLLLVLASLGVALWLSALSVQYRDVAHALAFAIQVLMYVSPVVYSGRALTGRLRLLYGLNPVAGVIDGTRSVLLGTGPLPWDYILLGASTSLALAISGLYYFRSRERIFADVA